MIGNRKNKPEEKMEQTLNGDRKDLAAMRTGRASVSIVESISVDYYGTPTPVSQVAAITVPESRMIVIQPWEQRLIPEIEKAIMTSSLGLTPSNDGKIIRVPVPAFTEDRSRDIVKSVE